MSWTNYHGHSCYCDGNGKPIDYVNAALERRMFALGFSSHAPVPFESFWNMKADKLADYISEIDNLKKMFDGRIHIYASLEIDFIEGVMGPDDLLYKQLKLDYTIGSVHFISKFTNGDYMTVDGSFDAFTKGLNDIFAGDIRRLVKEYFRLQRLMVAEHRPSIVGHLDKVKMHNLVTPLFDENAEWYLTELRHLLEVIARNGCIVEVNTKSFVRNGLLFPGKEHFPLLKELGIPLVINSDAHYADHLDMGFAEVAQMLMAAGINELMYLNNGKWIGAPFNENGLLLK